MLELLGTGAWQMGVLVILAMGSAIALGLPELVVVEAGVSAILIVALDPGAAAGFSPNRILEGIIGGATALAISATFFPPDPALAPAARRRRCSSSSAVRWSASPARSSRATPAPPSARCSTPAGSTRWSAPSKPSS